MHVGFLPLDSVDGLWLPDQRVVIVSSRIRDRAERDSAVAHMIGHVDIDDKAFGRAHRRGYVSDARLEQRIRRDTSRRVIPREHLADVLVSSQCAEQIADTLGVSLQLFADRVRSVTAGELETLAPQLGRLEWPMQEGEEEPFRCAIAGINESRMRCRQSKAITATVGVAMSAFACLYPLLH